MIRRSLAFAHTGFGGLLSHRLFPGNAGPQVPSPPFGAGGYSPRRPRPAVGSPERLHPPPAEIAESQRRAAPSLASAPAALLLPILHLLGHQHKISFSLLRLLWQRRTRAAERRTLALGFQNLTLIDPALHADLSVGSGRFR